MAAAGEGDADTLWALLSAPSRRRAGPTVEEFSRRRAPALRRRLSAFAGPGTRVVVSERLTRDFGLVALARGARAYALLLRRESGGWRVELPGPLGIEVVGPRPGTRARVAQIAAEARGGGRAGDALIYLDGASLLTRAAVAPRRATVYANLLEPAAPGRHVAVVFVSRGGNAAATAWTFVAR